MELNNLQWNCLIYGAGDGFTVECINLQCLCIIYSAGYCFTDQLLICSTVDIYIAVDEATELMEFHCR